MINMAMFYLKDAIREGLQYAIHCAKNNIDDSDEPEDRNYSRGVVQGLEDALNVVEEVFTEYEDAKPKI